MEQQHSAARADRPNSENMDPSATITEPRTGGKAGVSKSLVERWSAILVKDGWTPVPDAFLKNYYKLDPPIRGSEVLLLIHITSYKWGRGAPFPSFRKLATAMGISVSSVRAVARGLEMKGYLRRAFRVGRTNKFDLNPLFRKLEVITLQERERRAVAEVEEDEEI